MWAFRIGKRTRRSKHWTRGLVQSEWVGSRKGGGPSQLEDLGIWALASEIDVKALKLLTRVLIQSERGDRVEVETLAHTFTSDLYMYIYLYVCC